MTYSGFSKCSDKEGKKWNDVDLSTLFLSFDKGKGCFRIGFKFKARLCVKSHKSSKCG